MFTPDQQQKLIGNLLKKAQNLYCADCNGKSPCWASLDFGVFICMNCAGAHRALGPATTRVKSTKLDGWNKDWLWNMQIGNQNVNNFFQYSLNPMTNNKPNVNSSPTEIRRYVNDKYVKRLYSKPGEEDPLTRLKSGSYTVEKEVKPEKDVGPKKKQEKKVEKISQIQTKNVKKKKSDDIDLLGDLHASHSQNNSNKIQKNNINLFEDPEPVKGNLYDKDHFNSFSGVGAKSSHIDFESVWNEEKEKKHPKKEESFSEFQNINMNTHSQNNYNKNATNSYPANNNNLQYPIHQQNPYYPQQHVTMNINMNMYPNVMNINVNGTNNNVPNASPLNQINFSEPITLQTKALDGKGQKKDEQKKSWVDDWK